MGVLVMKIFSKTYFFYNFVLEGGQTKFFVGQIWTNRGQTNAIRIFIKFAIGGANFTELSFFRGTIVII